MIGNQPSREGEVVDWTIADAVETYHVDAWSEGYFDINARGHLEVAPQAVEGSRVDLHDLVVDLQRRGVKLPVLVRFSEILEHRLATLNQAFQLASDRYGYTGGYQTVYPIKVNQQCDIVEELLEYGRPWGMGLEAGSKPELLVALAYMDQPDGVIICNGFKDATYIETALLSEQLGRHTILVVDRYAEFDLIMRISEQLGVRPNIGVRAKLASKGAGRWNETAGEKSKFGLTASEIVMIVQRLKDMDRLECLELLHFHIGSQITEIRAIKDALRESARFFVELHRMGAAPSYIDVGGGLGIDYDGSKNRSTSSIDYTLQEYANDVVDALLQVCDEVGVVHPKILSESGRALSAYHSVLIFDVLGTNQVNIANPPASSAESDVQTIRSLFDTWNGITNNNFRESYHDALQLKEEAESLFKLGYFTLENRSEAEDLFWAICLRVRIHSRDSEFVAPELEKLEKAVADTYFCNFSVFQSAPDSWAVDQLFPVMPIHRLEEQPTRLGTLADLTCDSDGRISKFINRGEGKAALELHGLNGKPYYLGLFLIGAYQETLGDLHNLFGDTAAVHVSLDGEHGYRIEKVVEGDTVKDVLGYVCYEKRDMLRRVRKATEVAVRSGRLGLEHSARLLRRFEDGLNGYTYLDREDMSHRDVPSSARADEPSD